MGFKRRGNPPANINPEVASQTVQQPPPISAGKPPREVNELAGVEERKPGLTRNTIQETAKTAKADLLRLDLPTLLAETEPTCWSFTSLLHNNADRLASIEDRAGAGLLRLLHDICTYHLDLDNWRQPYGPFARNGNLRSPSIEDLNEEDVTVLDAIVEEIAPPELRARISDVLWLRRKHGRYAQIAVDAYLEAASVLMTPQSSMEASFRYARALLIAKALRDAGAPVIDRLGKLLEERRGDSSMFSHKILEAFWNARVGDPVKLANLAEAAAVAAEHKKEWYTARKYWLCAFQWHRRAQNEQAAQKAHRQAAEQYVRLADEAPQRMVEASHLEHAIHELRETGGNQQRIAELHQRMLAVQKQALAEFGQISAPIEAHEEIIRVRQEMAGLKLPDAIVKLAFIWRPTSVASLRASVTEMARMSPLLNMVTHTSVNSAGKTVARRGAILAGTPEEREASQRHAIFEQALQYRTIAIVSRIAPAWHQFGEEHFVGNKELLTLIASSKFIPYGRAPLFSLGLTAGFNGDFTTALHILIPQVEHAIRGLLGHSGLITSGLDAKGIQNEIDLGGLLRTPEAKKIFDEDLLCDLRGLLVEQSGSNLRNLVAHGLVEPHECEGPQSIYFWWLVLHLVVVGLFNPEEHEQIAEEEQPQADSMKEDSDKRP
jgi:hypothetical protein